LTGYHDSLKIFSASEPGILFKESFMQFARHFYAIAGILVVLSAASLGAGGKATSRPIPMPVNVTNPTSNPVNTRAVGTTQVSGSVTVANTGPISVQQDFTNFVPVSAPAHLTLHDGDVATETTIYTVPAGKMLVVQTESMSAYMDADNYTMEAELLAAGDPTAHMPIPISNFFASSQTTTGGAVNGTYYVPENTNIFASAGRASGAGQAEYFFTMSGYLIPMPTAS
jgi:hypothetical protein